MRRFGAALQARGARRFFIAHAQSSIGSGIAIVGLPLLAYDRFHTPWALTVVLLCELLPAVALGPVLGALADRLPRRTCLVAADVLRLAAFGALAFVPSLGLMIACALVAGIGTALFNPSALASLSQVAKPEDRPAAMSLYAVLDDIGLTLGPALAGALLIVFEPHTLMAVNAVTFTISAVLLATIPLSAPIAPREHVAAGLPALRRARDRRTAGREAAAGLLDGGRDRRRDGQRRRGHPRPRDARRRRLRPRRADDRVRDRDVRRLDLRGADRHHVAVAQGLHAGARLHGRRPDPVRRRAVLLARARAFALGGFGNGLALVHDRLLLAHAVPEALHGRLFALHKTCTSAAFVLAFVGAGILISTLGVQAMFLFAGLLLIVIILIVRPHLRALWPEPASEQAAAPLPLPAPGTP